MTPEQLVTLSAFLNTQANLPVEIQEIANSLKVYLTPASNPVAVEEEVPVTPTEDNG